MIIRTWRGRADLAEADSYLETLRETKLQSYVSAEGNLGVYVLRRRSGGTAEFLILSIWESTEAVRNYAGSEVDHALSPAATDSFFDFDSDVKYYEVLVAPEHVGA